MRGSARAFFCLLALSTLAVADDASNRNPATARNDEAKPLSKAELRAKLARGRLEKKIETLFRRTDLISSRRSDRPHVDDVFVLATFQMPLATRDAELRFEVVQGIDPSAKKVADYLLSTPSATVRDFKVVSRYKSPTEAQVGLEFVRNQYDRAKQYQQQLLAYLQKQQVRARSMRRC